MENKKILKLNKDTVRRLRKHDLEEVMGGTVLISPPPPHPPKPTPAQTA